MADREGPVRFGARRLFWKIMAVAFVLQLAAFAAAGAALYTITSLDIAKDFYSAHRSLSSAQKVLLPATAVAAGIGFLIVWFSTWFSLRTCIRRLSAPIERADGVLQSLAHGQLSLTQKGSAGAERWGLDDSADAVRASFSEKVVEIQRASKEVHNAVLALRYKTTGSEGITLKELRETTGSLDLLCKKLNSATKWFET